MVRDSDMALALKQSGDGYGGRRSSQAGRFMKMACLCEGHVVGKQSA